MSFDGATPRVAEHLAIWWTQATSIPPTGARDSVTELLSALVECEGMDAAEADAWGQRMAIARADGRGALPELADPVRSLAHETLDGLEAATPAVSDEALLAQGRLEGLQLLGAVERAEPGEWYRALWGRVRPPAASPTHPETERAWHIAQTEPGQLHRVIAGPVALGPDMQITSVEIYDGALAVRWHFVTHDGKFPTERAHGAHVEIADDLGTAYTGRGAGATRLDRTETREGVVSGRDVFSPAPPAEASTLSVEFCGVAGEMPL